MIAPWESEASLHLVMQIRFCALKISQNIESEPLGIQGKASLEYLKNCTFTAYYTI